MDPRIQIAVDYIKTQRAQGTSDDVIQSGLLQTGWPQDFVASAFQVAGASHPAHHAPHPSHPAHPAHHEAQPTHHESHVTQAHHEPAHAEQSTHHEELEHNPHDTRQKFTIRAALMDVFRAIKVNWLTFVLSLALVTLISLGLLALMGLLITALIFVTAGNIAGIFAMFVIVMAFGSLLGAMFMSVIVLSLRDGLNHRRGKVLKTLNVAASRMVRVALTNMLLAIITTGPVLVALLLVMVLVFGLTGPTTIGNFPGVGFIFITVLVMLGGAAWIIIALLRYILAPYIALIEPRSSTRSTFRRSRKLLHRGGQWFVFKGMLLVLGVGILYLVVTGQSLDDLRAGGNGVFTLIDLVVTFFVYGCLYALYRNRVAIKR